jgi:crotonobetainyl-CoA:carnitine CoA-transferase CaiB-like acyl-CoA transferase
MLRGLCVLDLTDEKGSLCGKIFGDLGADVIKIERPGGDAARKVGPFYHDIQDPEKSLYWFFFNSSKRGITLDLGTIEGREIFKRLVEAADIVVESFPPRYLDGLGLGYSVLSEINPQIIMTSITPFGQSGPYKDYKTSDIVAFALSGAMSICGDPDRPPLRLNPYHAYSYAGATAAAGTLIAYYYRQVSGQGQHVDVSVQESVMIDAFMCPPSWSLRNFF